MPMQANPFTYIPQNLGANSTSLKSQFIAHFSFTKPTPFPKAPLIIDLTIETQEAKVLEDEDFDKLSSIEEILRALERTDLYELVKASEMYLFLT